MESNEVTLEIERVEGDKNIAVVHVKPHSGVKGQEVYLFKNEKWEALSPKFVPEQTVTVTLENVKGNLLVVKVGDQETCSKNARSKLPKNVMQYKNALERAAKQAEAEKAAQEERARILEKFKDVFGYRPLVEPRIVDPKQRRQYSSIGSLDESQIGNRTWIRGRIHANRPTSANLLFLILRHGQDTVQVVINDPPEFVKFAKAITNESLVDVYGEIAGVQEPIVSVTQHHVEFKVEKLYIIATAIPKLPLEIEAASRPEHVVKARQHEIAELDAQIKHLEEKVKSGEEGAKAELDNLLQKRKGLKPYSTVGVDTRLDFRVLELRTQACQAIFRIQAGVCRLFREILTHENFTEIHTPKLISAASEGGAAVFQCGYFEKYGIPNAYLAQSPQLFKQMAIASDFNRVFEIGSVFRREDSNTHRHLTEFNGLDLEMSFKQHYHEVLDVLDTLFVNLFERLEKEYAKELSTINQQYPFEPLQYLKPSLRLEWQQAIPLLQEELRKPVNETVDPELVAKLLEELADEGKTNVGDLDDLSSRAERLLGRIVKAKFHTDFYILDRFPLTLRPFYTMPDPEDERFSNSYDLFVRGEEICSGAQRIHDPELLIKRAQVHGVNLDTIKQYIESFSYAAEPHGGGGIGLERLTMLYLGLDNIRKSSLFPRDPKRITP